MSLAIKRVYAPPGPRDGKRVLIDRLWPRGLGKDEAAVDLWLKDVAPSTELRKWFGHDPRRWDEFRKRYRAELEGGEALAKLKAMARRGRVTLVYGAKDEAHNDAVVLQALIEGRD
jgi:uncharacterized protein YeaO (DUF488 family)